MHCQLKPFPNEKKYENCKAILNNIKAKGKITTVHDLYSDIWQEVFQYFEVKELPEIFANITSEVDQVLFNKNNHYQLRGLIIDDNTKDLSPNIDLDCIISLTLHDTCCFEIIQQCIELRSLKLIGDVKWIISTVGLIPQMFSKLEQLTLMISGIGSVSETLILAASISSLRRLKIFADDFDEVKSDFSSTIESSKLDQLIISSCTMIDWNKLSCILSHFVDLHLLRVSLIDDHQSSIRSCSFENLHILSLGLNEVSFNWIVQLVATMPNLTKLKLNGLVREDGFVTNQKWPCLLESAPNIICIYVHVFLQQDVRSHFSEEIKATLRVFDLNLTSCDDDADCSMNNDNLNLWWNLTGVIVKQ